MSKVRVSSRAARIEADAARQRLEETATILRHKLSPKEFSSTAVETIRVRVVRMIGERIHKAVERPAMLAAVVGGITLFLLQHFYPSLAAFPNRPPNAITDETGPSPESLSHENFTDEDAPRLAPERT